MPTDIKLKNSVTATNAPSSLQQGEVAINITDKKVWVGNAATTPVLLLGSGADGTFTNLTVSGVASFADGTVSAPSITNIGDTNTGMYFPAADTIAFTEGGVESMRINASGNLGIGITNPIFAISVYRPTDPEIRLTDNANTFQAYADSTNGGAVLGVVNDAPLVFRTNATERMRLNAVGDLCLGIVLPLYTVTNRKLLEINGTNEALLGLDINGATGSYFLQSGNDLTINNTKNGIMVFHTNGTERMRISSAGEVGIGTNNPASGQQLTVQSGSATQIRCRSTTTRYRTSWGIDTSGNTTIDSYDDTGAVFTPIIMNGNPIQFWTSGTERMRINSSGNVSIGDAAVYSNARLNVVGNNGIFCRTQVALTTSLTGIYSGTGGMVVLRDNLNGGTALILYENTIVVIVSQSGSSYTTGTPSGNQIQLTGTNVTTGSFGISAKIATGTTTLNVGIFSVDND
jgi:hypothetical protein